MKTETPQYVIAIGASAGGMEEINSFFDHTPLDGVSYVIIQHLSPDFKSRMVELLARHSKLEVAEAENGMSIESNKVYLIPNDKFMTIDKSQLHLTDKTSHRGPHLTINTFFNSLAESFGEKSIGIVLSGMGSDGTLGVKAIKDAGGMIIARNPETSEFGSMPSSAIASGLVDFVLEPEAMPQTIEDYVNENTDFTLENHDDKKYIEAIVDFIREKSAFDFTDYKLSTILRRTKRRASNSGFDSLKKYLKFLKETPEEIEALSGEYLISVTAFFRDTNAFDTIQNEVIPELISKLAKDEELKLWVAGCATGEEAYSLAILIHEQLNDRHEVVKIFATDIDTTALEFAGKGIYSKDGVKKLSPQRLETYFTKEADGYQVKPIIRRMVIFAQHNLVKNPPFCNMQFISCRNVLIYMAPVLQKKVFSMLQFGLRTGGFLFLGSSENPVSIIDGLETIDKKNKIYKNLETKRAVRFDTFSLPALTDKKIVPAHHTPDTNTSQTLSELVNASLINELDCLLICVDENNHVVKSYGDTTKYLLQKNFNSNIAELLPRPLAVAFNSLSATAIKTGAKATVNGIKVKKGDSVILVNLSVSPLIIRKANQKFLAVTFSEDKTLDAASQDEVVFDEKLYMDQYTLNLEEELADLKEKLRSTHLQLDASNENMQSFNEELLSGNEEMQSSNEEMQSVNEELHTINTDYQLKNKELLALNDDLNNYFRSNINGQLFVNKDLLLMKYSPGTVKQINLLPTDIGRPLSNISTNIKFETFIEDIKEVIERQSIIIKEIEANNGKWYQIMTMPYIQADNTCNGAIITFNDITALKKMQTDLDSKNQSLIRINQDLDNFIHTASHDLLAPLGNIENSIAVMNKIKVTDPELSKFLNIINNSIVKFRSLIKDISVISKVENEMLAIEMVDLEELITNIEWSLEDKIEATKAVITRNLEVTHIPFSKKNLRSVVYNLISNSIKFSGDKAPVINVTTTSEKDNIVLCVQDNGVGIAPEDLKTIFEMYGRLNPGIEGQGIGLSLAKKIIDACEGSMLVESELGKGTKFVIKFKVDSCVELIQTSFNAPA